MSKLLDTFTIVFFIGFLFWFLINNILPNLLLPPLGG